MTLLDLVVATPPQERARNNLIRTFEVPAMLGTSTSLAPNITDIVDKEVLSFDKLDEMSDALNEPIREAAKKFEADTVKNMLDEFVLPEDKGRSERTKRCAVRTYTRSRKKLATKKKIQAALLPLDPNPHTRSCSTSVCRLPARLEWAHASNF